jgi:type II secretory ATPase GspE/PulE/Tfp pilus assembly ATPase PilB-like protein
MQSTLEGISPSLLQGVINELKGLMHLSLLTVRKTKQVEIERIYGHERILLRLRVLPGTHGEQATLQVLRGAALKFYQQQQQEKLGRDALGMAQKLQQQLEDIRRQSRSTLPMPAGEANTLPQIASLLKKMESQVQTMIELSHRTEQDFNDPE